jgi:hypothetical protein
LLTKDLTEIHHQGKAPYPKFYQVVINSTKATYQGVLRFMQLRQMIYGKG